MHLGLGAFFRAHGALYTAEAVESEGGDWGVIGVSLRSPDQRDRLAPQDFAYTALERGPEGPKARQVEIVRAVLVAREDPEAVLAAMSDPAIRVVTLTVTEKGYGHRPSDGTLDPDNPEIAHDIASPHRPRTAAGFIVEALRRRHEGGHAPPTVLSCDNLPHNGRVTRDVVLGLAARRDPDLAGWIEREGAFPSSMVDRIVPATTEADREEVAGLIGAWDASPVMHEPFRQWVVEDGFVDGARPAWERAGAQLVADVTPFEAMKLRCLNGTHSALAYLGYLAGYETIAETVADPAFDGFLDRLWREEIVPSLDAPPDTDLAAYTAALRKRYLDPAIRHRLWQIAMDGSQKLPQRLLGTLTDNLVAGRPIRGLALAVAAWIAYTSGTDERGEPIDVRDPLGDRLREAGARHADASERAMAFLALDAVFPGNLAKDERFRAALREAADALAGKGARGAVRHYAGA